MGFRNAREVSDAIDRGAASFCSFRKVPSQASTAGGWVDLSMAAGNPLPNYYASNPLQAAVLDSFRGIFHGDNKSPESKHIIELGLTTPTAGLLGQYKLLDYLLYYPFIDLDELDYQLMDNPITLPRYATGNGVQAMAVCGAPTVGGGSFTIDYINQDGVQKTSPTQFCATSAQSIASLVTAQQATVAGAGPFLKLASGDTGIRQLVGWQNLVANGGLATLVLVMPRIDSRIYEINTTNEIYTFQHKTGAPRIEDGAYLNFIMNCAATVAAGTISGHARFAWS